MLFPIARVRGGLTLSCGRSLALANQDRIAGAGCISAPFGFRWLAATVNSIERPAIAGRPNDSVSPRQIESALQTLPATSARFVELVVELSSSQQFQMLRKRLAIREQRLEEVTHGYLPLLPLQ